MALVLGVLLGAMAVFLLSYVPSLLSRQAMSLTAEKAEAIGEVTAYSLVPGVLFEDHEAIETVIAGIRRDRDVTYVVVEDTLGRALQGFNVVRAYYGRLHLPGDGIDPV